jgi:CheY-like chemotaxis protein
VDVWRQWNPDLILMDVHMPVMDGLQATRTIKSDPSGPDTIIIALTASALDEDRKAVTESGADGFLSKPCSEDQIFASVGSMLQIRYEYEGEMDQPEVRADNGSPEAHEEKLRFLPEPLIRAMRDAVLAGDKSRLDDLILKVREAGHADSADTLQHLADRYEYETLTSLLQEAHPS